MERAPMRPGPLLEVAVFLAAFVAAETVAGPFRIPLFGLVALVLLRRARLGARDVGLARAQLSGGTVLRAIGIAAAIAGVAWFVARPAIEALTGQPLETDFLREAVATPGGFALMLAVSWILAGFGEEWCFRAYPLTRLAALGPIATGAGLVVSAIVFGLSHDSQGPTGMWLTGMIGFTLGAIYLGSGRNLWLVVLAHGMVDTIAMTLFHFGVI